MAADPLAPGVWGVVATPFTESTQDVDVASLAKLVGHYRRIGVTGLTVLGVFGEAARLSTAEKRAVLEVVVDSVDLPIVVGASSTSTAPVIEEVELATGVVGEQLAGAMVQVNTPDPDLLANQLDAVHSATGAGLDEPPMLIGSLWNLRTLAVDSRVLESAACVTSTTVSRKFGSVRPGFATSSTPDVSRSRRCTSRGRCRLLP